MTTAEFFPASTLFVHLVGEHLSLSLFFFCSKSLLLLLTKLNLNFRHSREENDCPNLIGKNLLRSNDAYC